MPQKHARAKLPHPNAPHCSKWDAKTLLKDQHNSHSRPPCQDIDSALYVFHLSLCSRHITSKRGWKNKNYIGFSGIGQNALIEKLFLHNKLFILFCHKHFQIISVLHIFSPSSLPQFFRFFHFFSPKKYMKWRKWRKCLQSKNSRTLANAFFWKSKNCS